MAVERAKPQGLLARIDQHLTHPFKIESRAKHFYPTGASCYLSETVGNNRVETDVLAGSCHRAVAYEYYSTPASNPLQATTYYTFAVGKAIEDMLVEWFKQMGIFVARNVKFFNPDFHLSGELDMVVRESPGSKVLAGVECKTSYGDYYVREVITGYKGHAPAPKIDHVMQVMCYLDSFETLPYFTLIYIGRDKFDRIDYTIRLVDIDGDRYPEITYPDGSVVTDMRISIARMYNRYKDLYAQIQAGVLPARDFTPEMTLEEMQAELEAGRLSKAKMKRFEAGELKTADWRCRYCNFKDLCRGMADEKVDNFVERYRANEFKPREYEATT